MLNLFLTPLTLLKLISCSFAHFCFLWKNTLKCLNFKCYFKALVKCWNIHITAVYLSMLQKSSQPLSVFIIFTKLFVYQVNIFPQMVIIKVSKINTFAWFVKAQSSRKVIKTKIYWIYWTYCISNLFIKVSPWFSLHSYFEEHVRLY